MPALLLAALLVVAVPAAGEPLPVPERIVTLAPHLAELVHAVGAGDRLVGVSTYSDYPEAVRGLPVIGDAFMIDHERLTLLAPQLLLAWESGTPAHVVDELRDRGHRVEVIRTRGLADVAAALERVGRLTGHAAGGREAAASFRGEIRQLEAEFADRDSLRVFYQVSSRPLYTVNGEHYVSELIRLCGGRNVFADLGALAPMVSEEAVLERDPELLLAADTGQSGTFDAWRRWPRLAANRYDNRLLVAAGPIGRAAPRLVEAGRQLCARIEQARERRAASQPD